MLQRAAGTETKSAVCKAFAHYLRTGQKLPESEFESNNLKIGSKYNHNHDPRSGQFTFAPGSSAASACGGGGSSGGSNGKLRSSLPTKPHGASIPRPSLTCTGTVRVRMVSAKPGHQPIRSRVDIDERAAKFEVTARTDPGRIGRTAGDIGGPSYGTYQLSSRKGTLGEFIQSPEAVKFSGELESLRESSPESEKKWKEIAAREPDAFQEAREARQ